MIQHLTGELDSISRDLDDLLSSYTANVNERALLERLASMKVRIQRKLYDTRGSMMSSEQRRFQSALEERWHTKRTLEDVHSSIQRFENTLRASGEMRTNRLVSALAIFGFPVLLCASFFGFVFSELPKELHFGSRVIHADWLGIHWPAFAFFLLLIITGIGWMRWIVSKVLRVPL